MTVRKHLCSIVAMFTICALLITSGGSVLASSMELTQEEIHEIADAYIYFDDSLNRFVLDNNIKHVLSQEQVNTIADQLKLSNQQVQTAIHQAKDPTTDDDVSVSIADSHGNTKVLKQGRSSKGFGVTGITLYWNYANVKLNRDHARSVFTTALTIAGYLITKGTGYELHTTIFGIWAPHLINNGIWFHYNYFYGALSAGIFFKGITKAGWQ